MARLGRLLRDLDRRRTPVHVTPVARAMIEGIAAAVPRKEGIPAAAAAEPADVRRGAESHG